jgi:gamma-glutamyltranspeptidase/glutathione hydrolase
VNRARAAAVAPQPLAADTAVEVLRLGGNAIDAAVAAGFVQGVVDPMMCGPGGYASLVASSALRGRAWAVDGSARAGSLVRADQWRDLAQGPAADRFGYLVAGNLNDVGYESIAVPGMVAALDEAHRRWGRLPWSVVLEPAIALAEDGFVVTQATTDFWMRPATEGRTGGAERLTFTQAARRVFAPSGTPVTPGERLRQPDHANTLRAIASHGAGAFYNGELAAAMTEDLARNSSSITMDDLRTYRAMVVPAQRTRAFGRTVLGAPPPFGGAILARMLTALGRSRLQRTSHGSTEHLRAVAQAMRLGTQERAVEAMHRAPEAPDTTHVSVVDGEGWAVSMTHSLGYSSGVVTPTLGFLYNNYLNCFNPVPGHADSLAPGARRESSMAPTILLSSGRPTLVAGAAGATRIPGAIAQVVVNSVAFGMTPVEAVSAPRIDRQGSAAIHAEGRVDRQAIERLESTGVKVETHSAHYDRYFGRVQLLVASATGWTGASDPRGDGGVARYAD